MFVQSLKTLKLQTVTVLSTKTVVDARMGKSYLADLWARSKPFSFQAGNDQTVRNPVEPRENQPLVGNTSAIWAGRSVCFAGCLSSRFSTAPVGGVVSGTYGHSPLATPGCAAGAKPATRTPSIATRGRIS